MANVTVSQMGENERMFRDMAKRLKWEVSGDLFKSELKRARELDAAPASQGSEPEASPQENVLLKQDGNKLIITVDMSKDYGKSKSGKSNIIASTLGVLQVGDARINLTAWR